MHPKNGKLPLSGKKIVFVHCLNNFSGSPRVLAEVIRSSKKNGAQIWLITSKGNGFLSNISGIQYKYISYKINRENKPLWVIHYIFMQIQTIVKLILVRTQGAQMVYFNTVLHFLAEFFSIILFSHRIIHVHEVSISPKIVRKIYSSFSNKFCPNAIFVSKYVMEQKMYKNKNKYLVYNTVDSLIQQTSNFTSYNHYKGKKITLIASLNFYKGIDTFIEVASKMPSYRFQIVVDASKDEVEEYFFNTKIPSNINFLLKETNPKIIFNDTSIVINLSIPDLWIETFGLTILEGMYYGIPAIAPNIGGPVEIIRDGIDGYLIDPTNLTLVQNSIRDILISESEYDKFANNAFERSRNFSNDIFSKKITNIIKENYKS